VPWGLAISQFSSYNLDYTFERITDGGFGESITRRRNTGRTSIDSLEDPNEAYDMSQERRTMNGQALDAGALNFVVPGLGYLYLKTRTLFGLLLILGNVVGIFTDLEYPLVTSVERGYLVLAAAVIIRAAFAYDAYQLAAHEGPLHSRLSAGSSSG
jgi:hypothetical protein